MLLDALQEAPGAVRAIIILVVPQGAGERISVRTNCEQRDLHWHAAQLAHAAISGYPDESQRVEMPSGNPS
jgi:hypothetical protein